MPYVRTITQDSIAALGNMISDIDEVHIENGLRIVRREKTREEMQNAIGYLDKVAEMVHNSHSIEKIAKVLEDPPRTVQEKASQEDLSWRGSHFVEYHFAGEGEGISSLQETARKLFDDVVTSLRLLKTMPIGRLYSFHKTAVKVKVEENAGSLPAVQPGLETDRPNGKTSFIRYNTVQVMYSSEPFELLKEDILELKKVFEAVKECKGAVRIALDRFDSQYEDKSEPDKLIDVLIGLEALYSGEPQDLTYRLAMRCAKHLGKSSDDSEKIYDCLKNAYGIRSEIVHGRKDTVEESSKFKNSIWTLPAEMLEDLYVWLRQAILLFLMNGDLRLLSTTSKKRFLAKIDRLIARGEEFSADTEDSTETQSKDDG